MKCPAELYSASARSHAGLPELIYPFHDRDVIVTACGRLCLHRKRINISTVLAGQKLASRKSTTAFGSSASCTMISDTSTWSKKPCNPSTTRSARACHPCLRYRMLPMCPGRTKRDMAEGEELGSNLLQVVQRSPRGLGGAGSGKSGPPPIPIPRSRCKGLPIARPGAPRGLGCSRTPWRLGKTPFLLGLIAQT
jgi:hypothetical protein